jgi:hypothetical protein
VRYIILLGLLLGAEAQAVTHDVLVLYTDSAIATAGIESLNAQTDANFAWTNQAYVNSGVNIVAVPIGKVRSPLQETGDMTATLTAIQNSAEVKALRAQYYADIVLLVTNHTTSYDGVGSLWTTWSGGVTTSVEAFAVIRWNRYVARAVAHELGHAQGVDHDRATLSYDQPGLYHYGYRVCGTSGFYDIMAYACSGAAPLQQFSSPRLTYNGIPTGVDPAVDPANAADASRSLNENAALVGNFRNPPAQPPPPPPAPPTHFTVSAGTGGAYLAWMGDAPEYVIERKTRHPKNGKWQSGVVFIVTATTRFDPVPAGTYQYTVSARNAYGTSAKVGPVQVTVQ